jgi:hypothetical protein
MSVQRAREAAARGGWQEAYDLLMQANANGLADPDDLRLLGEVAYAAGHLDVTIEAWSARTRCAYRQAILSPRRVQRFVSRCTCSSTPR